MSTTTVIQIAGGLLLLVGGAELLVRSAATLARMLGLKPVIIGLTVVAFGTSAPELAVSLDATMGGDSAIAIGNVVGSNIANILLILGLSAAIVPLTVHIRLVRLDVPLMIGASILLLLFSLGGVLVRWQGALLLLCMTAYLLFVVWQARRSSTSEQMEFAQEYGDGVRRSAAALVGRATLLACGLAVMVYGANLLVDGSSALARSLGVSELVIGLTVVAVGTSAPELATSLVAAMRGERDIAVGNAIGSNIFNLLFVLGVTALVAPDGVEIPLQARQFDIPFMVAVAIVCLPILYTRFTIRRWEGILLFGWYLLYCLYLYLHATASALLTTYTYALLLLAAPLAIAGIVVSAWLELRGTRAGAAGKSAET